MEMFTNGVVVISCSDTSNIEIIRGIIGSNRLPVANVITEKINSYPWHIETKYYSADLNLVPFNDQNLVSEEFEDNIQAVVIHFDNKEKNTFKQVKNWLPFVKRFNAHVQLLICDACNSDDKPDTGITRHEALDWCLKNEFELVELFPTEDSGDEEDDFRETKGYKRVVQALHAHPWPDLEMKDPPKYQPSEEVLTSFNEEKSRQDNLGSPKEQVQSSSNASSDSSTSASDKEANKSGNEKIDALFDEDRWLFDAVGKEDPGGEAFEAMFTKILNMKEKASLLEGDEKKLYAEKIAIEFWKAMGGEDEEIAGLDDED